MVGQQMLSNVKTEKNLILMSDIHIYHNITDPEMDLKRSAPIRPKIFSISWKFLEILTKSYVGTPRMVSAPSCGESWIRPWDLFCCNIY